jgi:hypothetical protein
MRVTNKKSVWSRITAWLRMLAWLPGRAPKLTPPIFYTPTIATDSSKSRRYLLERYGAQLHPKIKKRLQAEERWNTLRRRETR